MFMHAMQRRFKNSAVQNSNTVVDSLGEYKINVLSCYMLKNRKMTVTW